MSSRRARAPDNTGRAAVHESAAPVMPSAPAQLRATRLRSPLDARTGVHGPTRHAGYRSLCGRRRAVQCFTAATTGSDLVLVSHGLER